MRLRLLVVRIKMKMKTDNEIEIPDSFWNKYVKKYRVDYKVFKGEEGIWRIKCKYGEIYPHSIIGEQLAYCFTTEKRTVKTYNAIKAQMPDAKEHTQFILVFPESDLKKYEEILQIKKRRHLSQEQKEKFKQRMKPFWKKRKVNENGI